MQLGFVSAIVPDLSLQEVLTAASQIGYDCIELMCWPVGAAERRYAGVTHVGCATNEHLHRPQPGSIDPGQLATNVLLHGGNARPVCRAV